MVLLGIIQQFEATHGSKTIHEDTYTIEVVLEGEIERGFVSGIDHEQPARKLSQIIQTFQNQYLDEIVGRATNENIAQYLMFNLSELSIKGIKVQEGQTAYVYLSKQEFDQTNYPAQLKFNLGHSTLLRERPKHAKQFFSEAIDLRDDFADAYNLRGRCSKYLEDYLSASKDFLEAININPNFGDAWRNLGNAYLYLGKYDEMITAFEKSIDLMPDSALAINNLGYGYFVMNKFEKALEYHEQAVSIDPNYAEAQYDKAMALRALGRENDAQKALAISDELKSTGKDTYHGINMY
jgi:tetratricopeptide (TPR) repeat protein